MSLLGNRGRFTQDGEKVKIGSNTERSSVISSIGTNPLSKFKFDKVAKPSDDLKDKLEHANLNKVNEDKSSSHEEYNERLNKVNKKLDIKDKEIVNKSIHENKKKVNIKLIVAMALVEIITLIGIYMVGQLYRFSSMTQNVPWHPKNVKNPEIPEKTIEVMKGYKTVAVFGIDSRTGSVDKGNNADVNMIINLNRETGDVQLISVYRDLYLSITDNNLYDKLNAAYRRGGPEQAVKALNKNFDLDIDSYFAFNWKAVADGIELLGGIDLEVTKAEYKYMNAFIHETCIATGIDSKNPAGHYIKSAGMQHLDGVQAVAYGRLRLMDSDFQRVERQKKVISLCLEKAKQLDVPRLNLIIEAVLPQIAYAFDMNEMFSLLRIVRTINITESAGCPDVNNVVTMPMGGSGDCVVPLNLEKAVVKLHKILFNVDDYTPTNSVKRYSNRITELRAKYTEENLLNESLKNEEESLNNEESGTAKASTTPKKRATKSNANNTNGISGTSNNNLPIDNTNYETEPEEGNLPISNRTTSEGQNSGGGTVIGVAPGSEPTTTAQNINQTNANGAVIPQLTPQGSQPVVHQEAQQVSAPGMQQSTQPSGSTPYSAPGGAPINQSPAPINVAPGVNSGITNNSQNGAIIPGPPMGNVVNMPN